MSIQNDTKYHTTVILREGRPKNLKTGPRFFTTFRMTRIKILAQNEKRLPLTAVVPFCRFATFPPHRGGIFLEGKLAPKVTDEVEF